MPLYQLPLYFQNITYFIIALSYEASNMPDRVKFYPQKKEIEELNPKVELENSGDVLKRNAVAQVRLSESSLKVKSKLAFQYEQFNSTFDLIESQIHSCQLYEKTQSNLWNYA